MEVDGVLFDKNMDVLVYPGKRMRMKNILEIDGIRRIDKVVDDVRILKIIYC